MLLQELFDALSSCKLLQDQFHCDPGASDSGLAQQDRWVRLNEMFSSYHASSSRSLQTALLYRSGGWPLLILSGGVLAYILQLQTAFTTIATDVTFWAILGVSVAIMCLQDRDGKPVG